MQRNDVIRRDGDDAFDDDGKCFCDCLNCSGYEKLCDTDYTRHCLAVADAAVLCDASM